MNNTNSSTDVSHSSSSSITRLSLTSQVRDRLGIMLLRLRNHSPRSNWKWTFLMNTCEGYFLFCSAMLLLLRNYDWGSIGNYISLVLTFPSTWLLHWLPYSPSSIIVACVFMGVLLLSYIFLVLNLVSLSSKTIKKFSRDALWVLMYLNKFCSHVMLFVWIGFLDCDVQILNRWPLTQQGCTDSPNDVMIAICTISIVFQLIFVSCSELVTCDLHPKSRNLFSSPNILIPLILRFFSYVSLIQMFVIPQTYSYISAVINVVIALVLMALIFRDVPYYRRWMNSIMFGYSCLQLASIGSIISSFVNINNDSNMGLGFVGMTLAFMVIGFVVGIIVMEIYTRVLIHKLLKECLTLTNDNANVTSFTNQSNLIHTTIYDQPTNMMYYEMKKNSSYKALTILLRVSLVSNDPTTTINGQIVHYLDIALAFSKAILLHKFQDYSSAECGAMLLAYNGQDTSNCYSMALEAFSKLEKISFLATISSTIKVKEIVYMAEKEGENISSQSSTKLQQLKRTQDTILALHRDFWKELLNDPVTTNSLDKVVRKINEVTTEAQKTFNEILNHDKSKTILRQYAIFVETIFFDNEQAQLVYQEAQQLDEEQRQRRLLVHRSRTNKISPIISATGINELSNSFSKNSLKNLGKDDNNMSDSSSFVESLRNEPVMNDSASVVESPEIKKDFIFRNGMRTPKPTSILQSFVIFYVVLGLALILGAIALSLYHNNVLSLMSMNLDVECNPQMVSLAVVRNIRLMQGFISFCILENIAWPTTLEGLKFISKEVSSIL